MNLLLIIPYPFANASTHSALSRFIMIVMWEDTAEKWRVTRGETDTQR